MKLSEKLKILTRRMQQYPVDISGIANELGLECHAAYLEDEISGMIERVGDDKYKITYNATHPQTRQRFTIAHELAHFLLHQKLIDDGVDDNLAYRSVDIGKYHNTSIGPAEETEANKLAAFILMPDDLIKRIVSENPGITTEELASKLNVSAAAMGIRRSNLSL